MNQDFDYKEHTKFLVPHKHKVEQEANHHDLQPNTVYCLLTKSDVNDLKDEVLMHINGRKFLTKVCKSPSLPYPCSRLSLEAAHFTQKESAGQETQADEKDEDS